MKIDRFEDIKAWQEARVLTRDIYRLGRTKLRGDFGLRDQIQRASVSVMANISEGFDSHSPIEFVRFLRYSTRSASELQSHLYIALDQDYISTEEYKKLYHLAAQIKNLIGGFIRYLLEKNSLQHGSTATPLHDVL